MMIINRSFVRLRAHIWKPMFCDCAIKTHTLMFYVWPVTLSIKYAGSLWRWSTKLADWRQYQRELMYNQYPFTFIFGPPVRPSIHPRQSGISKTSGYLMNLCLAMKGLKWDP